MSHINPDESTHEWSTLFRALLERYQHIVRLSLFGHTHTDEFKLAMSYSSELRPVGITTICGSVTTWGGVNPSFCVYEIDEETMIPIQRLTYSFDLEESNLNQTALWKLSTNWTQEYDMVDLSPDSLYDMSLRLLEDPNLCSKYSSLMKRQLHNESYECSFQERKDKYCSSIALDRYDNNYCTLVEY